VVEKGGTINKQKKLRMGDTALKKQRESSNI
jgi:hypothetical protein